jgi:hypothetical protein
MAACLALRDMQRLLGLSNRLAACGEGPRAPEAVRHSLALWTFRFDRDS